MPAKITITEPFGIGFGAIIAEELTETQAMHEAAEIEQYRVNVETSALAICIDVRFGKFLGPKIAGGFKTLQVAAKAVGYRLSGKRLYDRATERGFRLMVESRWAKVVAGAGSVKSSAGTYTACTEVMEPFLVEVIRSCISPISWASVGW